MRQDGVGETHVSSFPTTWVLTASSVGSHPANVRLQLLPRRGKTLRGNPGSRRTWPNEIFRRSAEKWRILRPQRVPRAGAELSVIHRAYANVGALPLPWHAACICQWHVHCATHRFGQHSSAELSRRALSRAVGYGVLDRAVGRHGGRPRWTRAPAGACSPRRLVSVVCRTFVCRTFVTLVGRSAPGRAVVPRA